MAKATNANILSAVRNELSEELQRHIPKNVSDNLQEVYDEIMNYSPLRNAIIPELVQRIGLQTVDVETWRNPLATYKKNPMRYGATHEETYVNMAKGYEYNPRAGYEYAFKQYQSYIMSAFHTQNVNVQYPVTVTFDNLRNALLSEYGIRDMMSAKLQSAITAANWDEYMAMKGLIDTGYDKELLPAVTVDAVTDEASAKKLLTAVKSAVGEFMFPNPQNNVAGATSSSQNTNLVWITTPQVNANISVEALAYAFNMDMADVSVRTVLVDKFGHPAIQGVLVDIRFFNVRDQFREFTDQKLANILSWNYFYTLVEMISPSPFYPIRVFTSDKVVQTVKIAGNNGQYDKGAVIKVGAQLTRGESDTGTYIRKLIDYEIESGATSQDTYILAGTDELHIGSDETGTIIVKATYRYDESITTAITYTPKRMI